MGTFGKGTDDNGALAFINLNVRKQRAIYFYNIFQISCDDDLFPGLTGKPDASMSTIFYGAH